MILWRRLDLPGHDAAMVRRLGDSIELSGLAVFLEPGGPTSLAYRVRCDPRWITTAATVDGWAAGRPVELRIRRDPEGRWTLNDKPCPAVASCLDLDLGFTPATNLLPLRRLDLRMGQGTELRSAWLEWPAQELAPLPQRYARRSPTEYDYEADLPDGSRFAAVLRTGTEGWVVEYPGLWTEEAGS